MSKINQYGNKDIKVKGINVKYEKHTEQDLIISSLLIDDKVVYQVICKEQVNIRKLLDEYKLSEVANHKLL